MCFVCCTPSFAFFVTPLFVSHNGVGHVVYDRRLDTLASSKHIVSSVLLSSALLCTITCLYQRRQARGVRRPSLSKKYFNVFDLFCLCIDHLTVSINSGLRCIFVLFCFCFVAAVFNGLFRCVPQGLTRVT